MTIDQLMSQQWFLFLIGFLGMVSHFLKKYANNQLDLNTSNPLVSMYRYFLRVDIVNTLLTVISYVVLFFVMYQMKEQGVLASFSAGYMSNSLFNKAEERGLKI